MYIHAELVLLIAAHIRIAHKVQQIAVLAGRRGHEVETRFGFGLEGQAFDGDETVSLGVADDEPPGFLAFLFMRENELN